MDNFLVIGTGSIGCRHIQCLKELGVGDIYIVEPFEASRKKAEKLFDIKGSFDNLDEALERRYDGVLAAVPSHLHAEVACKVIEKDLDLMLEKPVEVNLETAGKIQKALDKHNKVICLVAYCFRYDPGILEIKSAITAGDLGKIYSVDMSIGQYLPDWRPGIDYRSTYAVRKDQGGGVCIDVSHEFDTFRWLFGEAKDVVSVVAQVSDLELDVEDIVDCLITCENGTIGRIHIDYLLRVARRQMLVNGSEGLLEYDFFRRELKVFLAKDGYWKCKQFSSERNVIYKEQFKHFFECVKNRTQPNVTVADAIKTLELALRVRKT